MSQVEDIKLCTVVAHMKY